VIPFDARRAIDKIRTEKFDVIFLDPPYNMGLVEPIIEKLANYNILGKHGIIVVEHHRKEEFKVPENLLLFKIKDYNDTMITILIYPAPISQQDCIQPEIGRTTQKVQKIGARVNKEVK
jgi:16S rRNA G966 N2-methylase RsmD